MIVMATMLAACGNTNGNAAEAQGKAQATGATRLDVAGVRSGMSSTDVRATLEKAGWTVKSSPGRDWAATIAEEKGRQRNAPISLDAPRNGIDVFEARKGDESLIVTFRPVPAGAVVKHVAYEAPMAGRTAEQLGTQLVQRYGRPSRS